MNRKLNKTEDQEKRAQIKMRYSNTEKYLIEKYNFKISLFHSPNIPIDTTDIKQKNKMLKRAKKMEKLKKKFEKRGINIENKTMKIKNGNKDNKEITEVTIFDISLDNYSIVKTFEDGLNKLLK